MNAVMEKIMQILEKSVTSLPQKIYKHYFLSISIGRKVTQL